MHQIKPNFEKFGHERKRMKEDIRDYKNGL